MTSKPDTLLGTDFTDYRPFCPTKIKDKGKRIKDKKLPDSALRALRFRFGVSDDGYKYSFQFTGFFLDVN